MKVDLNKYSSEGYVVIEDFLEDFEIVEFESNLSDICKIQFSKLGLTQLTNDPLISLFNRGGDYRKKLYESIQQLVVFEKLKIKLFDLLDKNGTLTQLDFKAPILRSGVFISLPNEEFLDNPVHQDIYDFVSTKFLRFWIPLRKVNDFNGSMRVWPKSHLNGFVPPDNYSDLTYPTFKNKHYRDLPSTFFVTDPGPCIMFNPLIFHSTVSNKSNAVRFSLSVDILDLTGLGDFNDSNSEFSKMFEITKNRKFQRSSDDSYKKL